MKKMVFFGLLMPFFLKAQTRPAAPMPTNVPMFGMLKVENKGAEVRGTRFLTDDYHTGELWLTDSTHFNQKELQYKFDEVENTVQLLLPNGKETLLDAQKIALFRLDLATESVFYKPSIVPNGSSQDIKLFQILYESPHVLMLKLSHKKLVSVENTRIPPIPLTYFEYQDKGQVFVKIGEKPFVEIKRRTKRGLIAALPSKKSRLRYLFENEPKFANAMTFSDALLSEIGKEIDLKNAF